MADLAPRLGHVPVDGVGLLYREIGDGLPIIVFHGGPEFDHTYLLPELDRLAGSARLVYYDQRGRGRSADGVVAEDVGIESEMADVDTVRRHLGHDQVAVLGHSWGGLLAMEYATRYPGRVSQLILMNTAPGSHQGLLQFRDYLQSKREPGDIEKLTQIRESLAWQRGDLGAEADYLRIHFKAGLPNHDQVETLVERLRTHFTEETVMLARGIEHRLSEQTWLREDYDLLPTLAEHSPPTLIIHGTEDFIPLEVPETIARAIPGSRLVVLPGCGHFSYMEQPDVAHRHVVEFLGGL